MVHKLFEVQLGICDLCGCEMSMHRSQPMPSGGTEFLCPGEIFTCTGCGELISEDEVRWLEDDAPFCEGCAENQPQYVGDYKGIGIWVEIIKEEE